MCNFPQRAAEQLKNGFTELDTAAWKRIIDAFAKLGTKGLGFTGGEPLLRPDIFELLSYATDRGMVVNLNTNALLLTEDKARALCETGIDSLNISFDRQHLAQPRDRELFTKNVAVFRAMTRKQQRPIRIKLVLTTDPAEETGIAELARTAIALGVDRAEVLIEQSFARTTLGSRADAGKREESLVRLKADIASAKNLGVVFDNSARMLRVMDAFYRTGKLPIPCHSTYTSMGVDPYGRVFSCMSRVSREEYISRQPVDDLSSFWYSPAYHCYRKTVRHCRRCCLNCQQELNLLFSPWWI